MSQDGERRGGRDVRAARLPGVSVIMWRGHWMLWAAVLGLAAGFAIGFLRHPQYSSTAIVTVSADGPIDDLSLARGAQALARLATQPSVVAAPLRSAGLPDVAADPRAYVTVEAAPDAPILRVTGTSTSPATAQRIAATVGNALAGLRPFPPFHGTVVAAPGLPTAATAPGWVTPVGGFVIGAGLGLVLAATVPSRRSYRRPPATPIPVRKLTAPGN